MTDMPKVQVELRQSAVPVAASKLHTATLSFENMHLHGELLADIFRARHQSFIVHKQWNLPEAIGMEYDQYDTPASRWIAVHGDGEVYGGMRLTPTTTRCGIYSYMIRDAQRGLLDTIPHDLLYAEAPISPLIWESTRVFVSHSTPMSIRRRVHGLMVKEMTTAARAEGAEKIIALTAGNWERWYGRCGLHAEALGPMMPIDDGLFQCVMIDLTRRPH